MTKYRNFLVALFFLISFISFACTSQAPAQPLTPAASSPEKILPEPQTIKEDWEQQWEKTLVFARKEGEVVLYSALGGEPLSVLRQAFMKKYGIELQYVAGRGPEIAEKLLSERRAGLYYVDVMIGASTPVITTLSPGGHLDPIEPAFILPEVKDTRFWWTGKHIFLTNRRTTVALIGNANAPFLINTDMMKTEDLKSYDNLLDPKWKGNFLMDNPTIPGSGERIAQFIGWRAKNLDFLRALVKQEPIITRDWRLQVEWIARGKYPFSLGAHTSTVTEFMGLGMPIAGFTPQEGSYASSGAGPLSLVNKAPHPSAAKIFINWVMSKEGIYLLSKSYGAQSTREDVPVDFLLKASLREPGKEYLWMDSEDWDLETPKRRETVKQIFAPLLSK